MNKVIYFAYGSNMCTARLRYRVPSCRKIAVARLLRHQLRFHKRSVDGSGKCNAFLTGRDDDAVFGVVYEIPIREKAKLDQAEGLGSGYHEQSIRVMLPDGTQLDVRSFVADASHINDDLRLYSWYKEFVIAGAAEHDLPSAYIDSHIAAVPAFADPDEKREQKRRAEVATV